MSFYSQEPATVATLSSEAQAMTGHIQLITDILGGLPAMKARATEYLPQYSAEDATEYERRVRLAPWRPEFENILMSLASKPFTQPVTLPEGTPEPVVRFATDVDGKGSSLHTYSRMIFLDALSYGGGLVLVDCAVSSASVRTIADEKAAGLYPYWCHYSLGSIIACHTEKRGKESVVVHLRLLESVVEREGYG